MLGEMPVWYLFLGGSGAGLLLVTGVTMLFVPPWDRMVSHGVAGDLYGVGGIYRCLVCLFVPACATAAVLLVVGISCLALDLGATDRAVLLFFSPRLTFISAGAWLLSAAVLIDVALLAIWASEPSRRRRHGRVLPVAAVLLGLAVAAYTGLLLQSLSAVPLWETPLLPCLFVLSSLSCGVALMIVVVKLSGVADRFEAVVRRWESIDVVVLLAEAACAAGFLIMQIARARSGDSGTLLALGASLQTLLAGADAWVFWGVFGCVGLAAPLAMALASIRFKPSPLVPFAQAACALAGAFAMRWSITAAGVHPILQSAGLS